jgi:hypothetical protein
VQSQRKLKPRVKAEPPAPAVPAAEAGPVRVQPAVPPGKRPRALDEDNPFAG